MSDQCEPTHDVSNDALFCLRSNDLDSPTAGVFYALLPSTMYPPKKVCAKPDLPQEQKKEVCYPKRLIRQQKTIDDVPEEMLVDLLNNDSQTIPIKDFHEAVTVAYQVLGRRRGARAKTLMDSERGQQSTDPQGQGAEFCNRNFPPKMNSRFITQQSCPSNVQRSRSPQRQPQRVEPCKRNYPQQAPARALSEQAATDQAYRLPATQVQTQRVEACSRNYPQQISTGAIPKHTAPHVQPQRVEACKRNYPQQMPARALTEQVATEACNRNYPQQMPARALSEQVATDQAYRLPASQVQPQRVEACNRNYRQQMPARALSEQVATDQAYRLPAPQVQSQRVEACNRNFPQQMPARSVPVQRPPQFNDSCQRAPSNNAPTAACLRDARNQTDSDVTPDSVGYINAADFIRREQAKKAQVAAQSTETSDYTSSPNEEDDTNDPTYSDFVNPRSRPNTNRNSTNHGSDREKVCYQGFPKGVKPSERRLRDFPNDEEQLLRAVQQHMQDVESENATNRLKARARSCPAPDERNAQRSLIQRFRNAAQNACAAPSKSASDVRRPEGAQPCARIVGHTRVPESRNQERERPTDACSNRRDNVQRPLLPRLRVNDKTQSQESSSAENAPYITSTPISQPCERINGNRERPTNRRDIRTSPARRIVNEMHPKESSLSDMPHFLTSTPISHDYECSGGQTDSQSEAPHQCPERTPEQARVPIANAYSGSQNLPSYYGPMSTTPSQVENTTPAARSFPSPGQSCEIFRDLSPEPRRAAPAYPPSAYAPQSPGEQFYQAADRNYHRPPQALFSDACPGPRGNAAAHQPCMAAPRGPDEGIQQAACARQGQPLRAASPGPQAAAPAYQPAMAAPRGPDEGIQQAACARQGQLGSPLRAASPGPRAAAPACQPSMAARRGSDEGIQQQAACPRHGQQFATYRDPSPGPRAAAPAYQSSMGAPRGPDEGNQQVACARQVQPGSRAASPGPRAATPVYQPSMAATWGPDACARQGQPYHHRDVSPGQQNAASNFPTFAGASRDPNENIRQPTGVNNLRPQQSCPSSRDPSPGLPRAPIGTSCSCNATPQAPHPGEDVLPTFGNSKTGSPNSQPTFEYPMDEIYSGACPQFKAFEPPSNECRCQRNNSNEPSGRNAFEDVDLNKTLEELPEDLPNSLSDVRLSANQAETCPQAEEEPRTSLFRCLAQKLSSTYNFISGLVVPQVSTSNIPAEAGQPMETSESVRECKNAKRCGRVQFDEDAEDEARDAHLAAIRKTEIENLVKDTYCPGLIQETVDGRENFNRRSFTISFGQEWNEKSNRGGPPNEDPITLLEAFSKRLDLDKEHMSKNLKPDATEEHIDDLIHDYFASQNPSDLNRAIKCFFLSERLEHTQRAEQDKKSLDADVQRWATVFPNKPNEAMIAYTGHTKPTTV